MAERQPKRDIRTKALACMASRSTVLARPFFLRRRGKTAGAPSEGQPGGSDN